MAEVTLRPYRPGDWEALYALDIECFEPAFRFSRRAMRGFAESPNAITLLAESDRKLVGFCIVQIEALVGYVVTLDVAPAWRRQGLARRLMAEIETSLRTAGARAMALHVYTGNAAAVRFYEGIDFVCIGRTDGFYGRGLDALLYKKTFWH